MPANVTPEFLEKKAKYESARTASDKIKALQELISAAPAHKGGEKLKAQLKKKLAELKKESMKKKTGGGGGGVNIKKEGDAQIVIIGYPLSGKSTLLSMLTNARPQLAVHPYTTTAPEIGTMEYGRLRLQTIEIPAITEGTYHSERGHTLFSIVRNANGIIVVIDAREAQAQLDALLGELRLANINKPMLVVVNRCGAPQQRGDISESQPQAQGGRGDNLVDEVDLKTSLPVIELREKADFERVKAASWKMLNHIRIYTRRGTQTAEKPIVMKPDCTVKDLALGVHKEFLETFRFARVWRKGSPFSGQRVGLDFELQDEDVVEIFA